MARQMPNTAKVMSLTVVGVLQPCGVHDRHYCRDQRIVGLGRNEQQNYLLDIYLFSKASLNYFTFIDILVFAHYLEISFMNGVLETVEFRLGQSITSNSLVIVVSPG